MKIECLTIFPEIFENFLNTSLIGKAIERELLSIRILNIRDFADPPHFKVDDEPYGGGPGMLMKAEPIFRAVQDSKKRLPNAKVLLVSASGKRFTQVMAKDLSNNSELILICGRYEGVDERVIALCEAEEISIGDFVVMGGEVPSMAILEAVLRLVPEVVGNDASLETESFQSSTLEAPQYTRPEIIEGSTVPKELISGDHSCIKSFREKSSLEKTVKNRPDLLGEKDGQS